MFLYKDACEAEIPEIVQVHLKCFESYFLSSLGETLLENYYKQFLKEDNLFVVAKDFENDKIIGFCMGYYSGSQAKNHFEQKNKAALAKKLFFLCLKLDRAAISRCLKKISTVFKPKNKHTTAEHANTADLLSICILNDYRGKEYGVSEALLQNFEKKLIENKIKSYTLSVNKDNGRARNFYLKNGMKCIAEHDGSAIYIKTC